MKTRLVTGCWFLRNDRQAEKEQGILIEDYEGDGTLSIIDFDGQQVDSIYWYEYCPYQGCFKWSKQ